MALGKNFYNGLYQIKNPDKYIGDPNNCQYRSGWERTLCVKFDTSPNIIKWAIEPFTIQYLSPLDHKMHRYWPDFIVVYKDASSPSGVSTLLIEVKPLKESQVPKKQGKSKQRQLKESETYIINKAKWQAAAKFCKQQGWKFVVMTENEIFNGKLGRRK